MTVRPDILGVEAPLWVRPSSTRREDVELLAMPRLAGHAEESAGRRHAGRSLRDEYRVRLGAQGPRLAAMGVNVYRSALVPLALNVVCGARTVGR